jgi:hypothetical protein
MPKLLEKMITSHKTTRAAMAFVYLFVTFLIPHHHTCGLSKKLSKYNCDNSDHCCCIKTNTDIHPEISSKNDVPKAKTLSHSDICTACLYSITSKFTQADTKTNLINITAVNPSRIPFTVGIIKQSEWLTSVYLRAPPVS